MRLFVAVWPPAGLVGALDALDRPTRPGVRWTTSDQWHVTVAFLGEAAADAPGPLASALAEAGARLSGPVARAGPATELLGPRVLCLPVAGLDRVAATARRAAAPWASVRDRRPFRGHLTLARAGGRGRLDGDLAGVECSYRWLVTEMALVASTLDPDGARYRTLATAPIGPTIPPGEHVFGYSGGEPAPGRRRGSDTPPP